MAALRAGGRPEAADVHVVLDERRADGIVVHVAPGAHADRRVPGRTGAGGGGTVPIRFRVAQAAGPVSDGGGRGARLARRGGPLRPERRPPGQRRQPSHANAHRHHTDQQVRPAARSRHPCYTTFSGRRYFFFRGRFFPQIRCTDTLPN